ncbi:MAG TPA: CBS domain-containing protein [Methanothrix sp.]|nr:CBS domain-containing protein [Methanothrix sp.]HRW82358.1 CBS domain-containing protein [Methanothrix sp.]
MSKVKDYMQSPVYVIDKEEPVQRARNLMLKHYISRLLVMDGDKLAGIVTKHDISHRLSQAAPEWRRRPISKVPVKLVMTDRPITIYPGATLEQAAEIMGENGIDGLPVERDEGEIVGIITSRDLISYFVEKNPDSKVGDIMAQGVISVHRHHTIDHVLDEMVDNGVDRVVVCEDNATPVGVITHTNLAISGISDSKDELKTKSIKMARKESTAGRKEYRYVKDVPLVAEDVMSYPIIFTDPNVKAVDAARILLDKEICGLPVVDDEKVVGFFSTRDITMEVARWS